MREVGEHLAAEPKDRLGFARYDMERGARLSGSRFGYIVGGAALLSLALYRFALDRLVAAGFTPVLPPVLVREEAMYGTGFFPAEKSEYYEIGDDGLYLTGTSEVALAGLHMGEILEADELPLHYTAFSVNFRREAARPAATRAACSACTSSTRSRCSPTSGRRARGTSWSESWPSRRSWCRRSAFPTGSLNIPTSRLSSAAAKRYDIEAWFPSQERYREITSSSNTTDFQARRLGIRYRGEQGIEHLHAERHRGHRPLGARDPGELPGRRAGRVEAVRRAKPDRARLLTTLVARRGAGAV